VKERNVRHSRHNEYSNSSLHAHIEPLSHLHHECHREKTHHDQRRAHPPLDERIVDEKEAGGVEITARGKREGEKREREVTARFTHTHFTHISHTFLHTALETSR
jgi:hypothetical protein